MARLPFKIALKQTWATAKSQWDVILGAFTVSAGFLGLYIVNFTDFMNGHELHRASDSSRLGDLLKTVGDARIRFGDSAVWRDLSPSFEGFEKGDAVFTSSGGFVSVEYKDYEAAHIFPNSMVVLTEATAPNSKEKKPVMDTKKGKIKVYLKGEKKSPRIRSGKKEYEIKLAKSEKEGSAEIQNVMRGREQQTEITSSANIDVRVEEADPRKASLMTPQEFQLPPGGKYQSDRPQVQPKKPAKDLQQDQRKEAKGSELNKKKDAQSEKSDAKEFLKATSQLKGDEQMKAEKSELEQEVLKSLNLRLKKAGFDSKVDK